jgi:hypothetical protein
MDKYKSCKVAMLMLFIFDIPYSKVHATDIVAFLWADIKEYVELQWLLKVAWKLAKFFKSPGWHRSHSMPYEAIYHFPN